MKIHTQLLRTLKNFSLSPEQFHLEFTKKSETVSQAKQIASETEILIAVGGDGTALETITGAYRSKTPPCIGIIPLGTGNDLARALHVYELFKKEGLEGCLRKFFKGPAVPFDIWQVNNKELMINYLSIGLDAAIVDSFQKQRTKIPFNSALLNRLTYAFLGLFLISRGLQGNVFLRYWLGSEVKELSLKGHCFVTASNLPFYGGGTLLAPGAGLADGILEITPFLRLSKALGLFAFQKILCLRTWYGNKLTHFKANRVEIEMPDGNYLQIDGEDKTYLLAEKKIEIKYSGQAYLFQGD